VNPTLIYTKKKIVYLNMETWEGLPTWISEDAKRAIFRSIANGITTNVFQLEAPVLVATQLQIPIRDLHEVHTVFLRAMPRYQGIVT
jgi:alpha-L-arabinofuranosidase